MGNSLSLKLDSPTIEATTGHDRLENSDRVITFRPDLPQRPVAYDLYGCVCQHPNKDKAQWLPVAEMTVVNGQHIVVLFDHEHLCRMAKAVSSQVFDGNTDYSKWNLCAAVFESEAALIKHISEHHGFKVKIRRDVGGVDELFDQRPWTEARLERMNYTLMEEEYSRLLINVDTSDIFRQDGSTYIIKRRESRVGGSAARPRLVEEAVCDVRLNRTVAPHHLFSRRRQLAINDSQWFTRVGQRLETSQPSQQDVMLPAHLVETGLSRATGSEFAKAMQAFDQLQATSPFVTILVNPSQVLPPGFIYKDGYHKEDWESRDLLYRRVANPRDMRGTSRGTSMHLNHSRFDIPALDGIRLGQLPPQSFVFPVGHRYQGVYNMTLMRATFNQLTSTRDSSICDQCFLNPQCYENAKDAGDRTLSCFTGSIWCKVLRCFAFRPGVYEYAYESWAVGKRPRRFKIPEWYPDNVWS